MRATSSPPVPGRSRGIAGAALHPAAPSLHEGAPLLGAVHRPQPGLARRPDPHPQRPPEPIDPSSGCRIASRCPIAVGRCRRETPPLADHEPGHRVACHRAGEPITA